MTMAEHRPDTARPVRLRAVSPDTETGTAPDIGVAPVSPPASAVVSPASVAPVSGAARGAAVVANVVRELWLHPDRLVHSLWNSHPGSMADHYAYMTSREWVPESLEGKEAAFVAYAGLAYHILIGVPLLALSKALGAAAVRPLRFLAFVVPVFILVLLFAL
jgi:hypothetical protein